MLESALFCVVCASAASLVKSKHRRNVNCHLKRSRLAEMCGCGRTHRNRFYCCYRKRKIALTLGRHVMGNGIDQLWRRIHDFIDPRCPRMTQSFNPPATDKEIQALEQFLGFSLPSDFRQSLQIHNGQKDSHRLLALTLDGILMDVNAIVEAWKLVNRVDQHFWRTDPKWSTIEWWNPKWIPFTDNQSGDYLCINMDPEVAPLRALVYHVHDNPFHDTHWPSFTAWLEEIALKLERGQVEEVDDSIRVLDDCELKPPTNDQ